MVEFPTVRRRRGEAIVVVPKYLVTEIKRQLPKFPKYEGEVEYFVLDAIHRSLERIAKYERTSGFKAGELGKNSDGTYRWPATASSRKLK